VFVRANRSTDAAELIIRFCAKIARKQRAKHETSFSILMIFRRRFSFVRQNPIPGLNVNVNNNWRRAKEQKSAPANHILYSYLVATTKIYKCKKSLSLTLMAGARFVVLYIRYYYGADKSTSF
jgi:hypothetical protein